MTKTGDDQHQSSNTPARADIINKAIRDINGLEAERKAIGADIREIKQKIIKGDLTMKIADFNAALRLYQLEDDARAEFFDTLHETFNALGLGEQLSMFAPKKGGAGEKDVRPAFMRRKDGEAETEPAVT